MAMITLTAVCTGQSLRFNWCCSVMHKCRSSIGDDCSKLRVLSSIGIDAISCGRYYGRKNPRKLIWMLGGLLIPSRVYYCLCRCFTGGFSAFAGGFSWCVIALNFPSIMPSGKKHTHTTNNIELLGRSIWAKVLPDVTVRENDDGIY